MTQFHSDYAEEIFQDKETIRRLGIEISGLKIFIEQSGLKPPISYTTWADPPSGWKYGFPKALPKPEPVSLGEWLIAEGYPAKDAHEAAKYIRYWNQPDMGYEPDIDV